MTGFWVAELSDIFKSDLFIYFLYWIRLLYFIFSEAKMHLTVNDGWR